MEQFKSPFREELSTYLKVSGVKHGLKYQPVDKGVFANYPKTEIKRCINNYREKYTVFDGEELSLNMARYILEKNKWGVAYPDSIFIENKNNLEVMKFLQSKVSLLLCSIYFNDSNTWKARLSIDDCNKDSIDIKGNVKWGDYRNIGPIISSFKQKYPILDTYWDEISMFRIGETSEIRNAFINTVKVYIPFLKIEYKINRYFVFAYFLFQLFILLILLFKAENLLQKSEKLSVKYTDYYTKYARYLTLTFLFITLCFLNYEMLHYVVNAFYEYFSGFWCWIFLWIILILIILIYTSLAKKLLNQFYLWVLYSFASLYMLFRMFLMEL